MHVLDRYYIDIFKLSSATHEYDFEFSEEFLQAFEESDIDKGKGTIKVILEKNESFIKMTIKINGTLQLICDRSLDEFDYPLDIERKIIFKYGEEEQDVDDEIIIISRDRQRINLSQYIYEFIGLEVPMKRLHPRYADDENNEDELIYTSDSEEDDDNNGDDEIDPRWNQLKDLK